MNREEIRMSRRELREQIFKLLFRVEFHEDVELQEQENMFFEDYKEEQEGPVPEQKVYSEEDQTYIKNKFEGIRAHLAEIDQAINENTDGWKTARMGKVDLTLIRLAVYEIRYEEDIPTGVAINEAVELAKKFGTTESPTFVNGVLAKFA